MIKMNYRLLAFAMFAVLLAVAQAAPQGSGRAVNFTLRSVDGGSITPDTVRGDVVVLAFGATWLPLSREQVQSVQKLADQYSARNLRVYWVSTDSESPKSKNYATDTQLRAFAHKNGLKAPVLRDPDGTVSKQLGVDQLPAVVILDRQGNVYGSPLGGLDPERSLSDQLGPILDKLL